MPDVTLTGCNTEPLLSFLKALGVFRLIAEDKKHGDTEARAFWRGTSMVLRSRLSASDLTEFFHWHYIPTPIAVPWSGGDFFGVNPAGNCGPFSKAPTSTKIIEAFLATTSDRLEDYRLALSLILATMERVGVSSKAVIEGAKGKLLKSRLMAALRSNADEKLIRWIDAAAVIEEDRTAFNVLLGSGGGSDGNSHFSDNFMQHLWDVLPDFKEQGGGRTGRDTIDNALFGTPVAAISDRSPALFSSGGVGGPNASQGFEGNALVNSWDFILGLEGTLVFAGALTRKLSSEGAWAFPFSVSMSAAGYGTAVEKEGGQREIWFPLWHRPLGIAELTLVFSEGRSQTGQRVARTGTDFAQAIATYGVDAGIDEFRRFGFVKGRVGGENYTTAVPLGTFQVRERDGAALLLETDEWLDRFRRAVRMDEAPPRFRAALKGVETAILGFTRYGGTHRLAAILSAFGRAERELATGERFRSNEQRTIPPLSLNSDWAGAIDDGSVEYRIAAALAGIVGDDRRGVGDLRENMEPVRFEKNRWNWGNGESVVWSRGPLTRNLAAVLARRVMDGQRPGRGAESTQPAIWSAAPARADDVAQFLAKTTDDGRIEELLWGLALVSRQHRWKPAAGVRRSAVPLPRSYALLKLAFLPGKVRMGSEKVEVWADPRILARLRANDIRGAAELAARRLRIAGLGPTWDGSGTAGTDATRLAASLLVPVSNVRAIAALVIEKNAESGDLSIETVPLKEAVI